MNGRINKGITNIILIIFLFFVQFTNVPAVNFLISEKNISVYLGYIIVGISFILLLKKLFDFRGKITIAEFMLITGLFFTVELGAISGGSATTIWNEMYPFLVPLIIYYPIKHTKIKQNTILNFLFITCITGGIVAFLIANRVIEVDKWAAVDDYVRVAGFIDGTLGTVGFCCALTTLLNPEGKGKLLAILGLIGSLMIVLFGLSRLRLVIIICTFIVIMIIRKPKRSNFMEKIGIVLLLGAIFVLAYYVFPDAVDKISRMLNTRFSNLGVDESSTYRVDEMNIHMEQLLATWGMGTGWGMRFKFGIFVHNVYTGLLMHCGIIYGSYYIYYLLRLLIKFYKNTKEQNNLFYENLLVFTAMFVVILTGFGGAGITQTGAWYAMALVHSMEEKE